MQILVEVIPTDMQLFVIAFREINDTPGGDVGVRSLRCIC